MNKETKNGLRRFQLEDYVVFFVLLAIAMGFIRSAFIGSLNPLRIIILSIWLVPIYQLLRTRDFKMKEFISNKRVVFLICWLVYAVLSWFWVESMVSFQRQIMFLFVNISLVVFCTLYLRTERHFKVVSLFWILAVFLNIAIGLWEIVTGNHLDVSRFAVFIHDHFEFIPTGVFYNENDFATFLGLALPFTLMAFNLTNKRILQLMMFMIVTFSLYGILSTNARANFIVIILIFIFYFVLPINKKNFFLESSKKIALLLSFVMAVYVTHSAMIPITHVYRNYISPQIALKDSEGLKGEKKEYVVNENPALKNSLGDNVTNQVKSVVQEPSAQGSSTQIRINLIKNGLVFFRESRGLGVGAGNLEYYMENKAKYNTSGALNIHNWWLEILVNYGALVFVGYVIFYLSIIYELFKLRYASLTKFQAYFRDSLLLSLIGFSFASISSGSIINFYPQWILFGTALAFLNSTKLKAQNLGG